MPLTTHFWDWNAPVLDRAVAELTRGWQGGEVNLAHFAIIVPTAEAARRLREALARAAETRHGIVTAPHVWHPETALLQGWDGVEIASRLEERVAWMGVLQSIRIDEFTALFPVQPPGTGSAWAASVAEMLAALRRTLGAGGHDCASVAKLLATHEDADRWSDLARLERRYLAGLRGRSRADAQEAKRAVAGKPALPEGVREVIVLASPDLTELMRRWLRQVSARCAVRVFVQAPEKERASFDEFGTPIPAAWSQGRPIPIDGPMLRLAASPEEQAREAVVALNEFARRGLTCALGACDPKLNPRLESELAAAGVEAYNPAGRLAGQHGLVDLLRSWLALAESRAWKPLASFLRRNDVLTALAKAHDIGASTLLSDLDQLGADRLPGTLDDALALCDPKKQAKLRAALRDLAGELAPWSDGGSADLLRKLLGRIYGWRDFDTGQDHDRGAVELLGGLMETAQALDASFVGARPEATAWLNLLLAEVSRINLSDRRGEADLVLHGWLELLWEPAQGLAIAGFNDEHVPGALAPDPFLPDPLRGTLELASAESRRARDAYLLTAIAEQRKAAGALRLIVGRTTDEGDVLRPSRLLFECDEESLLGRISALFPGSEAPIAGPRPPRSCAWKLRPPKPRITLKHVSASLLNAYLNCPLRCYLRHVLLMKEPDSTRRELGADAFGNLIHRVWQRFASDEKLRNSTDDRAIADFLSGSVGEIAREVYGDRPHFVVAMQLESARQRLRAFAKTQRALRQDGWVIEQAELAIAPEEGLMIGGVPFKGKIDRVDRHEKTGALRVWDYKTGREGDPAKVHLRKIGYEDVPRSDVEWRAQHLDAEFAMAWSNLQLPLYAWALRQKHPGTPVEAGYLHLPATVSDAGERPWTGLNDAMIDSAHACAGEIVRRIHAGEFPAEEDVTFDEWEELFLGDVKLAVAPQEEWRDVS